MFSKGWIMTPQVDHVYGLKYYLSQFVKKKEIDPPQKKIRSIIELEDYRR